MRPRRMRKRKAPYRASFFLPSVSFVTFVTFVATLRSSFIQALHAIPLNSYSQASRNG